MTRLAVVLVFSCLSACLPAQLITGIDSAGGKSETLNIYSRMVAGDSLSSSFVIVIKKEVRPHKHAAHSEHVFVLAGSGQMKLSGKSFEIKKGDLVFIPKNEVHSVTNTGKLPLKVLSIQSPYFDGSDKVMVNE
jgi:mannose-6-phosphate isomerase-like protein (cupin superfamily)